MAPLYKRYTPAKPATAQPGSSANATEQSRPDPATPTPEKKRKRERTQEEIAERKAKKLKKKGVDQDTVTVSGGDPSSDVLVSGHATKSEEAELHGGGSDEQPQGEFAHVASAKKRHKLEKEARKARKAAKKDNLTTGEPILPENEGSGERALVISSVDTEVKDVDAGAIASVNSNGNGERVKEKRKKRRKDVEREEQTTGGDVPEDVEISAVDLDDAEAHDDEHLQKHNAVMDKFQKSAKRAMRHQQDDSFERVPEQPVVRHLELPPAERTPTPEFESENAALPSWLAKPTVVTTEKKATFRDLDIEASTADRLSKLGFGDALPVQQALIPILMPPGIPGATYHPGTEDVLPDVAVSAPTGSGKTIAYLLPMIEALRHQSQSGKLSALIIVPTRELVVQVAAVAESLVKGSHIKVGMATGTGKFKDEQKKIITRGARYDPTGYKKLVASAKSQVYPPDEDSDEFPAYLEQMGQEDMKRQQWIQDTVSGLVNHVPTYSSAVDILVATPGRLLEHMNSTLGFNLVHLQWLIIDEADKLLDNQYEGFLASLNADLERRRLEEEQDPREKYLRSQALWDERTERRLRKVMLSATMTRDISKLTALNLRRPKMIVVRGAESNDVRADGDNRESMGESSVKQSADGFELPRTLVEYCVPVGDGSEKPLVAVELLKSKVLGDKHDDVDKESKTPKGDDWSGSDYDSDSDGTSSLSSDDSDSSTSEEDSEEDSEVEDDSSQHRQGSPVLDRPLTGDSGPSPLSAPRAPTILIFTSSNESANRLSHLLQGLKPEWKSWITTLVKAKPGKARIRSKADEPAIVISTDRASRGLDTFSNRPITHVIQYDVPRTLTSYVHRVGRTARAGRGGDAWTLYTHAEARWFVNEVTKAKDISRRVPVERVKLFMADDGLRERYQQVLAGMRDEVFGAAS